MFYPSFADDLLSSSSFFQSENIAELAQAFIEDDVAFATNAQAKTTCSTGSEDDTA